MPTPVILVSKKG